MPEAENAFTKGIRYESIEPPSFWKYLFPGISLRRTMTVIVWLQFGCFVMSLAIDQKGLNPTNASLIRMGASNYELTFENLELWRLLTSTILYDNIEQMFFRTYLQWRFGISIEKRYGPFILISVIIMSTFVGVLVGTLQRFSYAIGGPYIFTALLAFNIMECIIDWERISNKDNTIINIMFYSLFTFWGSENRLGSVVATIATSLLFCWVLRRYKQSSTTSTNLPTSNNEGRFSGPGNILGSL